MQESDILRQQQQTYFQVDSWISHCKDLYTSETKLQALILEAKAQASFLLLNMLIPDFI